MNGLSFTFPVAFVAHDVLQVLVALYVVTANDFRSVLDDVFRDARFACYLYGKRRAGLPDAQLEECLHLVTVVEHGAIDHAWVVFGKVFQVLIVCRDDAKGLLLPKLLQHGFGNGTSYLWLGAASKLVNQ